MQKVQQSHKILRAPTELEACQAIEYAARTCYNSHHKATDTSCYDMVNNLISMGHDAMLEHAPNISVLFNVDRACAMEILRHRLFSFAMESQRYVYATDLRVSNPDLRTKDANTSAELQVRFDAACEELQNVYSLMAYETDKQTARAVLPNCTMTSLIATGNIREWRHFLQLRTAPNVYPPLRSVVKELLTELQMLMPTIFGDIGW